MANTEYKPDIFRKRLNLKPYEYPELLKYVDAIRHSYWVHEEFAGEFNSDVQDFNVRMGADEQQVVKRTMLAISHVEQSVKSFWGDIYKHMPKPEISSVGYTFAESEIRHHDLYAELLELLDLNHEFEELNRVPAIADRTEYLAEYLSGNKVGNDNKSYSMTLLLFSIFIEHVSLFSQFLIMMAFNRHKGMLKGISNGVEATSKEEQIHGQFGITLIGIIREENPEWFDDEFEQMVQKACRKAYKAEHKILDWIYEDCDLDFIPRATVEEFLKDRFNKSLEAVKVEPMFDVDAAAIESVMWFDEEILSSSHVDFFHKRPTSYSKNTQSFTEEDLF